MWFGVSCTFFCSFSVGVFCTQQLQWTSKIELPVSSNPRLIESSSLLRRHAGSVPGAVEEDSSVTRIFRDFKAKYGKQYADGSEEHEKRARIFYERLSKIERHNSSPSPAVSWRAGVNKFTDWTEEELKVINGFKRIWRPGKYSSFVMNGGIPSGIQSRIIDAAGGFHPAPHDGNISFAQQPSGFNFPGFPGIECVTEDQNCASPSFCCMGLVCGPLGLCQKSNSVSLEMDWSDRLRPGLEVRDQGNCGSCWAMAATNTIQLQAALLMDLSEVISGQDLMCATPNPNSCGGTGQCQGATPELGFIWAMGAGLLSQSDLSYSASCATNSLVQKHDSQPLLQIKGYHRIMFNNRVDPVMQSLVTAGPLAVGVDASHWFQYSDGVFNSCSINATVNHAVTLMGYGFGTSKDNGLAYWNILNSWGSRWGENGHLRLERVVEGEPCGWDHDPMAGVGCTGGPKMLYVCGKCGVLSDVSYPLNTHLATTA